MEVRFCWLNRFLKSYKKDAKKPTPEGVPSIKQVLPTIKNKFVGATSGRPRAFNERPYITKGQRFFVSVLFHTPCYTWYSVLHLLSVLSGGDKPPLCKGRWLAQARRRDCKKQNFIEKQSLSHLR